MRYEGIGFNVEWIKSMTEQEFIDSPLNKHLWSNPGFAITAAARRRRLRELWRIVNKQEVAYANSK